MAWDNNGFGWFVIVLLLVIGALIYWSIRREAKRRAALEQLAASLGLQFSKEDPIGIPGTFAQFDLFKRGETRYAYNVIHGAIESRDFCACDFRYTTTTYDNKGNPQTTTTYCSVAIAQLNGPVPAVWLRPENFLDKAAHLVGFHDLEFESAEFNRAFHVKAANREIAFDILNAQTMQRLLSSPFRHIEFNGDAVLVFRENLWQPEQFAAALDLTRSLAEGLPNYLWQKLRERAQS